MLKFTKSQLKQIIEEEAQKVKKEFLLRKELKKVEKELKALNEVHPGGEMQPGPEGYHAGQKKAVFTKKGSHLIENPEEEEIMAGSEGGEDMDAVAATSGPEDFGGEMGGEMGGEGMGVETLDKETVMNALKELGRELGLTGVIDFSEAPEGEMGGEMGGEEEITIDEPAGEEMDVDINSPEGEGNPEAESEHEHEEEVDETQEPVVAESTEDVGEAKDGGTDIDHSKLAPAAKGTPIIKIDNPSMTEGASPKKSAKLLAEEKRWKILAGIGSR